jgi:hypothetical protein
MNNPAYLYNGSKQRLESRELILIIFWLLFDFLRVSIVRFLNAHVSVFALGALVGTHSAKPNTEVFDSIDGVLLRKGKSRMLIQSPSILFRNTVAILDVKSDDTDFAGVSGGGIRLKWYSKMPKEYLHYLPAVEKRYHLFHQGFGRFSFRC